MPNILNKRGYALGKTWAKHVATQEQLSNLIRESNYPLLGWQDVIGADDYWIFIAGLISGHSITAVEGLYRPDITALEAKDFWYTALAVAKVEPDTLLTSKDFVVAFCQGANDWAKSHIKDAVT
jgi:hypothetical protein